jgi:hypothetical protein
MPDDPDEIPTGGLSIEQLGGQGQAPPPPGQSDELPTGGTSIDQLKQQQHPGITGGLGQLFGGLSPERQASIEQGLNEQAHDTSGNVYAAEMLKGAPIAGAYVPQTQAMESFEQGHPAMAAGLGVAGGMGAMPFFPPGSGLGAKAASQAALSGADTAIRGGSLNDTLESAATAAGLGIAAHGAGQLQKMFPNGVPKYDQLPTKVKNAFNGIGSAAGFAWAAHNGFNPHDIWESIVGGGFAKHALPQAWNAIASGGTNAAKQLVGHPIIQGIVQSGINHLTRKAYEPEVNTNELLPKPKLGQKRGGRTSEVSNRTLRLAHAAKRGRRG